VIFIIRFRVLRWWVTIGLATAVAMICVSPTVSRDFLTVRLGGERGGDRKILAEIDRKAVEYVGPESGLLGFAVYRDAICDAVLLRYGAQYDRVSTRYSIPSGFSALCGEV